MKRFTRGFTMIELAISVAMATFVVMGLYGIFTMQSRQLLNQDLRMEMHQNARFALEILSRSVRMAGFGSRGSIVGEMGTGGDSNPQMVVVGYDGFGSNGSDAITIAYMEPSLVMDTSYSTVEACSTSTLTFNPNHLDNFDKLLQFRASDLLMCYDYAAIGTGTSFLWSITEDAASGTPFGTIGVDSTVATLGDFSTACPSGSNISPVIRCSKGQVMTFYIDDSADGIGPGSEDHPVLMMDLNNTFAAGGANNDDVPLVDNIEDMQFQYCVDGGDDTQNCELRLNWVNDFSSIDVQNVWMVRILLVVRSPKDNFQGMVIPGNTRPQLANNSATITEDGYYRDIVVTEVTLRNIRLF